MLPFTLYLYICKHKFVGAMSKALGVKGFQLHYPSLALGAVLSGLLGLVAWRRRLPVGEEAHELLP